MILLKKEVEKIAEKRIDAAEMTNGEYHFLKVKTGGLTTAEKKTIVEVPKIVGKNRTILIPIEFSLSWLFMFRLSAGK
jgi:hypothetical protein